MISFCCKKTAKKKHQNDTQKIKDYRIILIKILNHQATIKTNSDNCLHQFGSKSINSICRKLKTVNFVEVFQNENKNTESQEKKTKGVFLKYGKLQWFIFVGYIYPALFFLCNKKRELNFFLLIISFRETIFSFWVIFLFFFHQKNPKSSFFLTFW